MNRTIKIGPQSYNKSESDIIRKAAKKNDLKINPWIRRCAVEKSKAEMKLVRKDEGSP